MSNLNTPMCSESVIAVNDDFPIRTHLPVHSGKVRSVYWLTEADSARLIKQKQYCVPGDASLAIMVISDRLSAFDCVWRAEGDLMGVPGKGAALNAISNHWFECFKQQGLADSHILETPHPMVWVVQKAEPVKVEAICRAYITGSMWRAYEKGSREFSGFQLPEGLEKNQPLDQLLVTPTTKGILRDIPGVPETDDTSITKKQIVEHYTSFNFKSIEDIARYENLLKEGFRLISQSLGKLGQILVDTKFEFGYVRYTEGGYKLIYMDEVGTPDSSRIWEAAAYQKGQVVENSKESFRQFLLGHFSDPDILLNAGRMQERQALAKNHQLPLSIFSEVSSIYVSLAEKITGKSLCVPANPRAEIIKVLKEEFDLIE